jgi:hypothetical protein
MVSVLTVFGAAKLIPSPPWLVFGAWQLLSEHYICCCYITICCCYILHYNQRLVQRPTVGFGLSLRPRSLDCASAVLYRLYRLRQCRALECASAALSIAPLPRPLECAIAALHRLRHCRAPPIAPLPRPLERAIAALYRLRQCSALPCLLLAITTRIEMRILRVCYYYAH